MSDKIEVNDPAHYEKAGASLLKEQDPNPEDYYNGITGHDWELLRSHVEKRVAALRMWRESWWMQNWADLAEYINPRRSIWMTQSAGGLPTPNNMTRGREINKSIIDPTATYAMRICAGGLTSGLASPSRPWFKFVAGSGKMDLDADAKRWIDDTEDRIYTVISGTNFYESNAQEMEDLVTFGTGPCIIYEDEQDVFRCYNPCVGEYMLANSSQNRIDGLYRLYLDTVSQMVGFFGVENCPPDVQKMWHEKGGALDQERIIGHSIEPNFAINENGVGVVPGDYDWREVYWVWGSGGVKPLSFRGFHEQPFTVSRWSTQSNDAYGRCPGMDVLPDVMQLQVMVRRLNEAIEKQVRPPLLADDVLKNQPSSSLPGHVTYVPGLANGRIGMRPIYEVNPDINGMTAQIMQLEQRIKIGLFNDLFLMLENSGSDRMTAYEVAQKMQEKMQVLGPVIENLLGVLKLKLVRIYNIMKRRGLIEPMPDSLKGKPVNIEFVSMLALSQKAASTGGLERLAALIGNLSGVFPEAKEKLDVDSFIDQMADLLGTPHSVVRSTKDAIKLRQQQAQVVQQQMQMQQQAHAAQVANTSAQAAQTLSQTQIGGGQSALDILTGQGK